MNTLTAVTVFAILAASVNNAMIERFSIEASRPLQFVQLLLFLLPDCCHETSSLVKLQPMFNIAYVHL